MRFIPVLVLALAISACDLVDPNEKAMAVDPSMMTPITSREQALIFGADGAMQQGNYATAERDYLAAVAISNGHVDAHLAAARLYEKQQMPQKEQAILERALELQPNHPLVNYLLGKLYLNDFRYADALTAFQRGRTTRPDDVDLTIGEAIANDMTGKHAVAQQLYGRILRHSPQADLTNVRTNLAMSYLLSGDPKKAVELLKDEVKKPNVSPVTRHNLAIAYGLLGKNTEAKALLNGEVDEETRQLTLARMKEYLAESDHDGTTPPLQPMITETTPVEPAIEPGDTAPVPVAKPAKKEAKPVAKPKPAAKAEEKPVVKEAEKPAEAKPAEKADKPQ